MNSNNKKIIRNLLIYLGIPILLVVLLLLLFDRGADQTGLKYSDVLSYFEDGKVSAYSLNLGTGEMKLTVPSKVFPAWLSTFTSAFCPGLTCPISVSPTSSNSLAPTPW